MANYSTLKSSGEVAVYADMNALIAATGMSDGDQAFVTATNNLYIYSTSGWYKIATVQNDSPSAITGVEGAYSLATDGTATTITAVSTDPEGFPLTWSYSTSGLGSIATVSQADNVFTITPSTDSANAGTFTLTINATDGANGAVSANTSIRLVFSIENSQYTTLLATAVDTSDNNNLTDSSSNNRTVTAFGDAHAGTFSPYRQGGYSAYFNGTSDYLQVPDSSTLDLPADFTIEFWMYRKADTSGTYQSILGGNGNPSNGWNFYVTNSNNVLSFFHSSFLITGPAIEDNRWYHVALTRSGTTLTMYVDGTSVGTATTSTSFAQNTANAGTRIGYDNQANGYFHGYLTDVRVVQGTAVYTTNFTPPEERLTAITNTSLLTCHLPYFADGSTNDHAITPNGDVSIQPFAPYDYAVYSATSHGGSYYFNSATDYFTVPDSADFRLGSADSWCWEGWVYRKQHGSREYIIGQQASSYVYTNIVLLNSSESSPLNSNSMMMQVYNNTNYIVLCTPTNSIPKNTWTHFAVQYSSSSGWSIYLNGKNQTLTAHTGSAPSTSYGWYTTSGNGSQGDLNIGRRGPSQSNTNSAQTTLADIKWTPSIQYSSNFTPPTSPSSSTNAIVHFKGTDASIIDKSQVANLELVGDTVGTTAQVKFAGSKSMAFDGTGDYIKLSSPVLDFGTGDFTIECWARTTNTANNGVFALSTSHFTQNNPRGIAVAFYTNFHNWILYANGTTTNSVRSHTPSTNTWYHIAVVRTGGYTKLYIDGTEIESRADSYDYSNHTALVIGGYYSGSYLLPGNIQDFRVTKGLARYTANFTPPTDTLQG